MVQSKKIRKNRNMHSREYTRATHVGDCLAPRKLTISSRRYPRRCSCFDCAASHRPERPRRASAICHAPAAPPSLRVPATLPRPPRPRTPPRPNSQAIASPRARLPRPVRGALMPAARLTSASASNRAGIPRSMYMTF